MKTLLLCLLAIIILLSGGFIYLQVSGQGNSPFRPTESGVPQVTTATGDGNKLEFKNYGLAPEFTKINQWFNAEPLTMDSLKGKVVLVNFWTYSCITCVRALPYFDQWSKAYQDQGLVIIGVHTPEYAFEKVTENLKNAVERYKVSYPVAQDNSYAMWNAYNNQFWPTIYLVDREGKIVYTHFGDGRYDITENAVKNLLNLPGGLALHDEAPIDLNIKPSQKFLFGTKNSASLANNEEPINQEQVYTFPETLRRNSFALEGVWTLWEDKAALTQGHGRIRLNFNAAKVKLIAQSIKPVTVRIIVDGKQRSEIDIREVQDYELFTAEQSGRHTLEMEIPQPGFEASAFIFE